MRAAIIILMDDWSSRMRYKRDGLFEKRLQSDDQVRSVHRLWQYP